MIANSIQIGWSNIDFTLLAILLPLLVLSAFFSCSETAFFRLTQAQCLELQRRKSPPANAALQLVRNVESYLLRS